MRFTKKLGKIGNSLYVIIPKSVVVTEKLQQGIEYDVEITLGAAQ
jgi:antitoxin component of MazEF toxin-antitoxin module